MDVKKHIIISSGEVSVTAQMNDTDTAAAIYELLPLERTVNRWGDELHFAVPVFIEPEQDATEFVEVGDLGYWPVGDSFCIFCGKTPYSIDDRPRACGPVTVIGRITGDVDALTTLHKGDNIRIEHKQDH